MTVSSRECWVNTQYLAAGCKHKAKNRLKSVWHVDFFEWFVPVWQINKIKLTEKNNRPEFPFFFPGWRTLPGVYVTFVLWKLKKNKIQISWRGCRNFQQSFSHVRQLNLVPYEREVAVAGEAGGMGGVFRPDLCFWAEQVWVQLWGSSHMPGGGVRGWQPWMTSAIATYMAMWIWSHLLWFSHRQHRQRLGKLTWCISILSILMCAHSL